MNAVRQKIEEIIDRGEGPDRQVIVRVGQPDAAVRAVLDGAAAAIQERQFVGSARELLPARAERLGRGAAVGQDVAGFAASLASQAASRSGGPRTSAGELRQASTRRLEGLMRALPGSRSRGGTPAGVQSLWIAGSVLATLSKDQLVALPETAEEPIEVYPNNPVRLPSFSRTRALPANLADNKTSAYGLQAIGALASWGAYEARGQGVKVAVLDTGVDPDHPDLAGKLAGFAEFASDGSEVAGAEPHDSGQHGTHVAGTVLGGDASGQWIGVAPAASLLAGLVLPGGSGTDAQIIAGMQWALEQGADVISMSLGGLTFEPEVPGFYTQAIVTALLAGAPVVTAIGNDGDQVTGPPANDFLAFAVGATDERDQVTGFSGGRTHALLESAFIDQSFLPLIYQKPDVSAPGFAVRSALPGGGWEAWNGTSMATPHVAGAVALLLSGTSIRAQVEGVERAFLLQDLLAGTAEELGERGHDQRFGFGRIDVLRAIGEARDRGFRPEPAIG